ncbi:hypothetical protein TVAG_495110 [Trichomonas vaginalis G3]|uniref:Uncharacterized protein n=1 Tax=Trichomonas vaginalis (strain ATCC PRA-98 / G3) TaxID=412133 RepID=A2FWP6_TRIV3|nr:hypothetical protein TVAGG3_0250730 [Trichomonas vaginalis G3]EAX90674.1 hypothetical protein TVAG_495110 [Trichomonas vaginalis G3]KAI5553986.1 hypothetical protein TVAGG3_0250730 [Trichomonas vaginalis G3]|eukprot:XP_001303604.1 hypothetical protein [Trichomonas vaginalis G3]
MIRDWENFDKYYPDREVLQPIALSYLSAKHGIGIMPDDLPPDESTPAVIPTGIFTQKELFAYEHQRNNRLFALPYHVFSEEVEAPENDKNC